MHKKLKQIGGELTCPVAIIERGDKILVGQRNYTKEKWKDISVWTIPGGRSDQNETIEQALRREVQEEVGVTQFEIVDFIGEVPGAKEDDLVPMFFCTTTQDAKLMEPEKFSEWRWVTIKEYINNQEYSGFNLEARKMIVDYLMKLPK